MLKNDLEKPCYFCGLIGPVTFNADEIFDNWSVHNEIIADWRSRFDGMRERLRWASLDETDKGCHPKCALEWAIKEEGFTQYSLPEDIHVKDRPMELFISRESDLLNGRIKITHAIPEIDVKENDIGIITGYLPKDKMFAIFFGVGKWIVFSEETEEIFLKRIVLCEK